MKYVIIGSGKIGPALARVFARKNIEIAIANSRGPETLAPLAKELGASIFPKSVVSASGAEIIFLAVPFSAHKEIAVQLLQWHGKILVDVTNAFHVSAGELGERLSSEIVADAFTGARVVKAFNHLPAQQLGTNEEIEGQRQAVFVSSNDTDAGAIVAAVADGRRTASCRGWKARRPSAAKLGQTRLNIGPEHKSLRDNTDVGCIGADHESV